MEERQLEVVESRVPVVASRQAGRPRPIACGSSHGRPWALMVATPAWLAARQAFPGALGSRSSSDRVFVATPARRPAATWSRSLPSDLRLAARRHQAQPRRRGGRVVTRRIFQSVFAEVGEEIEHQPAIFLGEIAAVILLSAVFEKGEHALRSQLKAYGDKTGKQIIDALFKEVTVLGFIGLLLFLVTKSGAADQLAAFLLGGREWGAETENPLAETFETVHIMIFMLLVVLLFQSLAVLVVTRQVSEEWGKFERQRAFGVEESSIESQMVKSGYLEWVPNPDAPRQTELRFLKPFTYGDSFFERLELRQDTVHKLIMFRAIRHEFLYPRQDTRSVKPRVRDPATFSFENYLRLRLGVTVRALVEIDISTWVATLIILVPIIYLSLQLPPVYAQAVQCSLAWLLVAAGVFLTWLLEEDTWKFAPQVPEDGRQILRLFCGTSTQMLRRASQVARGMKFAGGGEGAEVLQLSSSGRRYRPGLGDAANMPKPKLKKPPFFWDDPEWPGPTYLGSKNYEQALRFIGFLQAISVTVLIVSSLGGANTMDSPLAGVLYLLTWAEWPVMLFKVVPVYLRRLTIRNSIEGKKDKQAIRLVSMESNDGLLRDFLLLVRLAGLGRRAAEDRQKRVENVKDFVNQAVEDFGTMAQSEQYEIWNLFAVWDADNTGTVEPREVETTFSIMGFSKDIARDFAKGLVNIVDEDGSGLLTWRKLRAATMMATHSDPQEVEEDLEVFFELLDENGDGAISVFELTRGLRRMRIGIKTDDMANLLYQHFGEARLKVKKSEFVGWAQSINRLNELRTVVPAAAAELQAA